MTYKYHENGKMLSRNFIKTYLDMSTEGFFGVQANEKSGDYD